MGLKDILVVLDDTEQSEARLRVAVRLARASGAYLIGACPHAALMPARTDLQPVVGMGLGYLPDALDTAREIATTRAERAEQMLHEALHSNGLEGEWHDETGDDPLGALIGLSRRTDLVVIGQADPGADVAASVRDLPELVLMQSARPVLFVPYIGAETVPFKTVLICWNDSGAATRAVNDALPFLKAADAVTVLAVDPSPLEVERTSAADVAAHLRRHGVKATCRETISDGLPIADVILNNASDDGSDLIVMGGYGHSRTREHLFGGVTLELLRTMTVPVLMSH